MAARWEGPGRINADGKAEKLHMMTVGGLMSTDWQLTKHIVINHMLGGDRIARCYKG